MKRIQAVLLGAGLALALALVAAPALAPPAAVVQGVQMPAWVEHDGVRTPLAPGMALVAGDQVSTGADSRLLVRFAEGSQVKLEANATLAITEMQPDRGGIFSATLHVLEGAFRFTTEALAKARRRDVTITLNTVTAGIRGTDLWGRSTEQKQTVCLIEGKIEIKPDNEAAITMDRPLEFYQRERGKSLPVGQVSPEQLAKWAAEAEALAGRLHGKLGVAEPKVSM
jgi:hypothetical protein